MAFWGVEVKPGKPITHYCEKARGRLRISQATLGISEATNKTIVQCNVGNKSPVLLCVLLPNKTESCHLELEFEEADDVVFSVIGPRSVYLTGYYVVKSRQLSPHSDTESYGVDIENTQTDGSSYRSDEDKYDDSFINDDVKVSPKSLGADEATAETNNLKHRSGRGKQHRKKYRVIESDNDANSHESEDEDGYYMSLFNSKGAVQTTISDDVENVTKVTVGKANEANDNGVCGGESKQVVDPLDVNDEVERERNLPLNEGVEVENEIPKEMETLEENIFKEVLTGETTQGNNETDNTIINQNLPTVSGEDQMQSLDIAKPKKKRKRRTMKEEKTCEVQTGNEDHSILGEDKEHEVEATTDLIIGANYLATPPELDSASDQKSDKRRNAPQLEGTHIEGLDTECHNIREEDKQEQGLLHGESVIKDLPPANGESWEQQRIEETSAEGIGTKCPNVDKEDELHVQGSRDADSMIIDMPAAHGEQQEQHIDNNSSASQFEKRTKKKTKRTRGKKDLNTGMTEVMDNQETTPMNYEDQTTNAVTIQNRTLSNGLVIEELASGPPDGKVARPGKRIKFFYTGMLKETGVVFDSNIGKTVFEFRLGDEEFIDGWNVGIDGMHVGDKRRLVIPPSMGFGNHGMGENVPPNSWLVYEIELVEVRK